MEVACLRSFPSQMKARTCPNPQYPSKREIAVVLNSNLFKYLQKAGGDGDVINKV